LFAEDPKKKGKIAATAQEQRGNIQGYFHPFGQAVSTSQISTLLENPLHVSYGRVPTAFTASAHAEGDESMHKRHLTSLPEQVQQYSGSGGPRTKIGDITQPPVEQIQTGQHGQYLGWQANSNRARHSPEQFMPGQPKISSSFTDTLHGQQLLFASQAPDFSSLKSPMNPCTQMPFHTLSNRSVIQQTSTWLSTPKSPNAHRSYKPSPKRPPSSPNPTESPPAKRLAASRWRIY
jgi:hypothetical protein